MTGTPDASAASALEGLSRIEQMKAHEYVAEQLRRQVWLRIVQPGQALPSERALVELFGVGRPTVQQAIKLLEDDGLVERRRGRSGGTFVRLGIGGRGSSQLLATIRRDRDTIVEALDYRRAIEPAAAAAACRHADDTQLAGLAALADRIAAAEDDAHFEKLDTEFHISIARVSGNRFLAQGVEEIRLHLNAALMALPETPLWHERSVNEHSALMSGLRAREPEVAGAAMRVHIEHTDRSIRAMLAGL